MIALRTRDDWLAMLRTICAPVLHHGAAGTLKTAMPCEAPTGGEGRRAFMHLEACARMLAGLAPWLELAGLDGAEAAVQAEARQQAQALIASITDPASPDYLDFSAGMQPLVDAGFLAQAILRAPTVLWNDLPSVVRANAVREMAAARAIVPPPNNWILFPAMIEAFFSAAGLDHDAARIDDVLARVDGWYLGDGWYRDGPDFCLDYYNSFVIHPLLIDILRVMPPTPERTAFARKQMFRGQRHAAQIERMIGPDGALPAIGRSLAYRSGNLHLVAQLALLGRLPAGLEPAHAREAMGRAIGRSLTAPGTFDADGWLAVGLGGHQPGLSEDYISTGSLYLCAVAFLPLGRAPDDAFWIDPAVPTSGDLAYDGGALAPDRAVGD